MLDPVIVKVEALASKSQVSLGEGGQLLRERQSMGCNNGVVICLVMFSFCKFMCLFYASEAITIHLAVALLLVPISFLIQDALEVLEGTKF